MTGCSS